MQANYTQASFVVDRIVPQPAEATRSNDDRPARFLVRELPASERPVNRCLFRGADALSMSELIAAVLQSRDALALAQELLARFGGLDGLVKASVAELCNVAGIGPSRAAQIKVALELGRRLVVTTLAS